MEEMKEKSKSRFLKITCPKCNKNQTVFGKSATAVKCDSCNYLLLKTRGGKSKIRAKIQEVL